MRSSIQSFDSILNPRALSELQVLRLIYQRRSMTRYEIAETLGWNQTKVVRLVTQLLERRLLRTTENPADKNRPGRPSELLQINPLAGHTVGIEFGRNSLRGVLTDAVGNVVFSTEGNRLPPFEGTDETITRLTAFIHEVVSDGGLDWSGIYAVGIALHDIVDSDGHWITHESLHAPPYDVRNESMKLLDRLVVVEDISRAFAVAEHRFGAGLGSQDMIYVFLGSHGVGSGIFVNNEMMKSSSGVCGEIGHVVVEEGGKLCSCGNFGCFEVTASQSVVVNKVKELINQGIQTAFNRNEPITFEEVCRKGLTGDKVAYLVLHELATHMGKALASAINITGTPHVIVGGELALAGEAFLADLRSELRKRVIGLLARRLQVRAAKLPKYAGAWGVAIQGLEKAWLEGGFLDKPKVIRMNTS
jgi:N-acetylglucosamine repressor